MWMIILSNISSSDSNIVTLVNGVNIPQCHWQGHY